MPRKVRLRRNKDPDRYSPGPYYPSRRYRPRDPIPQPPRAEPETPWYKNRIIWIITALIIGFFIINHYGWFNHSAKQINESGNLTTHVTLSDQDKLVNYVIKQQKAGKSDVEIKKLLMISGYNENDIDLAFGLADPTVQWIIKEQAQGMSRTDIVEGLLKQGKKPEEIKRYFEILDQENSGMPQWLQDYWIPLLIAGIAVMIWVRGKGGDEEYTTKIYTLEEARKTSEDYLKEQGLDFDPIEFQKNRTEIRQFRFAYKEPIYPEFNDHRPFGIKQGGERRYYLIGISYQNEVIHFEVIKTYEEMRRYVFGSLSGHIEGSLSDYMQLRDRSEQPIPATPEERVAQQQRQIQIPRNSYRARTRYNPGPIFDEDFGYLW